MNLVIGNTSQLSYYFPDEYIKISSRDIDLDIIKKTKWERIFLCFGESRKNLENFNLYDEINFNMTVGLVDELKNFCDKIIVFSTCELYSNIDGPVDLNMDFDFCKTHYTNSKFKLTSHILNNRERYENVLIMYPFNFNSTYRDKNFLFGKIFYSIINKEKINIGDTYFYRDIIHPKFVVEESINSNCDKIIGSGRLTFINDFIRKLYSLYGMNYEDYIKEDLSKFKEYNRMKEYYLKSKENLYSYDMLVSDTIVDIEKKIIQHARY